MKKLNLGCGYRYHSKWINIDSKSNNNSIIAWDLRKGIPFPDNNFDVVYHSHLLEHFSKYRALDFMKECFRVIRPGGVLRVVVPDLEVITRIYLQALDFCVKGSKLWSYHYQWLMLEMYDQAVRNYPGGEMKAYLTNKNLSNKEFVISRCGAEARKIIDASHELTKNSGANYFQNNIIKTLINRICEILRIHRSLHEKLKKIVLGEEYEILKIGRFRNSGEVHLWMYDRHSLSGLFDRIGMEKIVQRSASDSYIGDWTKYCLDTDPCGSVYKPDSLIVEGIKPTL